MAMAMKQGFREGVNVKRGVHGDKVAVEFPRGLDTSDNPDGIMDCDRERVEELWDELFRNEEFFQRLLERMK